MFRYYLSIALIALSLASQALADKHATATPPLEKEAVFNILAAEFAIQRNQYTQALDFYLDQAKTQKTPYFAERATQLAMHEQHYVDMLTAALVWQQVEPDNEIAHFFTSLAYAFNMQPAVALENMRKVLRLKGETDFSRLVNLLPKGNAAETFYLQELTQASKLYPENYDVALALALLYQRQDMTEEALKYTDKTVQYANDNLAALEYAIRIYHKLGHTDKALQAYQAAVAKNPDNLLLRQNFAQYSIQYNPLIAREQLEYWLKYQPQNDYVLLNLGLIALEQGNINEAEPYFLDLRASGQRLNVANYYLGEIYKYRGELDKALATFATVTDSEEADRAREKMISIYIEQERFGEASALIQSEQEKTQNQRHIEQLHILHAANLEKQGNSKEAYLLLSQLLDKNPDSFELRYNRAMLAETKNELVQMESDLRYIITLYPNNALALNALGYTLADKTNRYNEALELIQQAQRLVPDDPAILDSLGWVLFRLGRVSESIVYLKQALLLFPDAEIASHLGEALWVSGNKKDARKIFQEALDAKPDHVILQQTIKRLNIGL